MGSSKSVFILLVGVVLPAFYHAQPLTVSVSGEDQVLLQSTTTIICSYSINNGNLESLAWLVGKELNALQRIAIFIPPSTIAYPNNTYQEPDYQMTVSNGGQSGSSVFTIQTVQMRDNVRFWCTGTINDGTTMEDSIPITVNVLPSSVVIIDGGGNPYGDKAVVVQDKAATFTCTATGQVPYATIMWTLGGTPQENWPNGTDTNTVTLTPDWSQHTMLIECTAFVPADTGGVHKNTELDVKVPPVNDGVKLFDDNNRYGYNGSSDSTAVFQGVSHTLTCSIEATRPGAQVTWTLDKEEQTDGVTRTTSQNPVEPLFTDTIGEFTFTPSDCTAFNRKEVECTSSIPEALGITEAVMLILQIVPDKPVISSGELIDGSGTQSLRCEASNGYPDEGQMWWQIAGKDIVKLTPTFNTNHGACRAGMTSMFSYVPDKADNGVAITCEVHHPSSKTTFPSVTVDLNVKFCSETLTGPQSDECMQTMVAENPSPDFTCISGSSNPATTLTWYLDNMLQENTHSPRYDDGVYNGNITTLPFRIETLTKNHNGVSLQCRGINPDIATCSNLRSKGCILNILYPPEITAIEASRSELKEGGNVTLTCTADANPQPDDFVYWLRDDQELDDQYNSGTSVVDLDNIDRSQAGTYQCVADNDMDTDTKSINVTVYYSPNITNKEDNSRGADEGSEAVLVCRHQANPAAVTSWYHPDGHKLVNGENRVSITNKTLHGNDVIGITIKSEVRIAKVQPHDDYGDYRCNVSNGEGGDSFSINLDGTRKPDDVSNAKVTSSTLDSLTVVWTPGYDGGESQHFLIAYRLLREHDFGDFEEQVNSEHTINGLSSGTDYEIIVYSKNRHGQSAHGDTAIGRTRQIPDPPTSVTIVEADSTANSLNVTWIPGDDGGDPQWFHIDYGKTNQGLSGEKKRLSNGTSHVIVDLSSGTEYTVAIYSENVNGLNELGTTASGNTLGKSPADRLSSGTVAAIVGGIIGTILVLVIVALSVYLLRGSNNDKNKGGGKALEGKRNTSNGHGGIINTSMDGFKETNVDESQPTYAKVNKKTPKDESPPVYAEVKKGKSTAKSEESEYDDVANVVNPAANKPQEDSDGRTVTQDGLIYQEVGHFKSHPVGAPPIQTEASTEYAALDFNRMKNGQK